MNMNARLDFLAPDAARLNVSTALLCCPRYAPENDTAPELIETLVTLGEKAWRKLGPWFYAALSGAAIARQ